MILTESVRPIKVQQSVLDYYASDLKAQLSLAVHSHPCYAGLNQFIDNVRWSSQKLARHSQEHLQMGTLLWRGAIPRRSHIAGGTADGDTRSYRMVYI